MGDGIVRTWPRVLLQLEGATIFGTTLWAYSRLGGSWWTFAGLLFIPDLGMSGYLKDTVLGSATYNTLHTETPPLLLMCYAWAKGNKPALGIGLAWLAHIGMDRMIGAGLKYGTAFTHTHLGGDWKMSS